MNPEIKTKWVEALRSGEFKQGSDALKRTDVHSGQTRYCCLGVLTELAIKSGVGVGVQSPEEAEYEEFWLFDDGYETLPLSVCDWAGMEDNVVGSLPKAIRLDDEGHRMSSLAELNDNGMSFAELADVIEKEFW